MPLLRRPPLVEFMATERFILVSYFADVGLNNDDIRGLRHRGATGTENGVA